jgi:predicted nuclease of predicted toxin-antitoxin system
VKFLVDAQLPRRIAAWLTNRGHDAVHTLDLPRRNLSPDADVCAIADKENRIVVTKDDDFVRTFLLLDTPQRLLLVATGNISNNELIDLFDRCLVQIGNGFAIARFVEVNRQAVIVHG